MSEISIAFFVVIVLICWGTVGVYCAVCSRHERRSRERQEEIARLLEVSNGEL